MERALVVDREAQDASASARDSPITVSTTTAGIRRWIFPNMLDVSEAITRAALLRKESRGAQFREDYPEKDPEWGKYNIVIQSRIER